MKGTPDEKLECTLRERERERDEPSLFRDMKETELNRRGERQKGVNAQAYLASNRSFSFVSFVY